jgi:S-adenosylmethionine hydrolase
MPSHHPKHRFIAVLLLAAACAADVWADTGLVVLQTDFGTKDQAVAAMRGVIRSVDRQLAIDDLTHEIPAYNVWEAAYRLNAVIDYWPPDTVFVSVVDPGVGTQRRSVVARLDSGHMIVTPDNGTLTLVAERIGVAQVREIDESKHRLPGSNDSFTFHGRDIYAYVGALLASRQLAFDAVGPLQESVQHLAYEKAQRSGNELTGGIPVLDPQYGNVWTNMPSADLTLLGVQPGDWVALTIDDGKAPRISLQLPYVHTFGDVAVGTPLLYANSVGMLAVALNQGDFAAMYHIAAGPQWRVKITRVPAQ